MLSSRQKKKTAETQQKDSSDGMKFTFRKMCFFIVSAWTFPCPHLSRKICLALLKMLLVNWQKPWKWNLWSPESSVKELKQSQEWKRLQPSRDHRSLCSLYLVPQRPAISAAGTSPHVAPLPSLLTIEVPTPVRPKLQEELKGWQGATAVMLRLEEGSPLRFGRCNVCATETVLIVSVLEGKEKKKHVLPSEDVQGEKKYHNL